MRKSAMGALREDCIVFDKTGDRGGLQMPDVGVRDKMGEDEKATGDGI